MSNLPQPSETPEEGYREMTAKEFISVLKGEKVGVRDYKEYYGKNSLIEDSVLINKVIVNEPVLIFGSHTFQLSISIHGGKFNGGFIVHGANFKGNFFVKGGEFKSYFWIMGGTFEKDFLITEGMFEDNFSFAQINIKGSTTISGGEFRSAFIISDGTYGKPFKFGHGEFKGPIIISGGTFSQISIEKAKKYNWIEINGQKVEIGKLKIQTDRFQRLNLRGIRLDNLVFQGTYKEPSSIELIDLKLQTLEFEEFFNLSNFFLTKISVQQEKLTQFRVTKSQLGAFECKQVAFKDFQEILIQHSNLTSLALYDSDFPVLKPKALYRGKWWAVPNVWNMSLLPGTVFDTREHYRAIYEIYRDLTKAASEQEDVNQRLKYFAASQWALLKSKRKGFTKDLSSKITLTISRYYSNFGQSWGQAFLVTSILGAVLFLFYLWASPLTVNLQQPDWQLTSKTWAHFFQFLNPTHRFDFMKDLGVQQTFLTSFIDFASRIFIALGIFETIRSFRKYVRK